MFDPRKRDILEPEQHFEFEIDKTWADYDYETSEGKKYTGEISQEGDTANEYTNSVLEFKNDIATKNTPEEQLTLFKEHDKSPFKKFFENIELNEFEGNDSVVEDEDTVPYDSQEQLPSNIESQQEQEVVAVVSKEEEANGIEEIEVH